MLQRVYGKANPSTLVAGMLVGIAAVKYSVAVPQKAKNRTAIWSSNPTPGHIPREKRYLHPSVHCSTIDNSQDMGSTQRPTDRITDKEDGVHISSGILHSHSKEGNNTTGSNMDGPGHYHTKWRKSDGERQICDSTYLWNVESNFLKMIPMNSFTK